MNLLNITFIFLIVFEIIFLLFDIYAEAKDEKEIQKMYKFDIGDDDDEYDNNNF